MENDYYYVEVLKEKMEILRTKNPQYSLRAFSNSLDIDASTLSKVLNRKRNLPASSIEKVLSKLDLAPNEEKLFINSISKSHKDSLTREVKTNLPPHIISEELYFEIIANWEYYAILNIIELDNFKPTFEHISMRLGIDLESVEKKIETLLETDLLRLCEKKRWIRTYKSITTTNNIKSESLKQSHLKELELAKSALLNIPVEERGFYSATVKTNSQSIAKAKKASFEYLNKLVSIFEKGPKEEVYQVGLQIFPLTRSKKD